MTLRFPGLVAADWRSRLVRDHARLFPDVRLVQTAEGPSLSCCSWPDVPDGWRNLVGTACRRLEAAVAGQPEAELAILDMKEKYGTLRLSVSHVGLAAASHAAVTLAVDLAEARSAHLCDTCGRRGRLCIRGGWYATRCEEHAEGWEPVRSADPDMQVTTRSIDGRLIRTARRYDPAIDSFVPVSVPNDEE